MERWLKRHYKEIQQEYLSSALSERGGEKIVYDNSKHECCNGRSISLRPEEWLFR